MTGNAKHIDVADTRWAETVCGMKMGVDSKSGDIDDPMKSMVVNIAMKKVYCMFSIN